MEKEVINKVIKIVAIWLVAFIIAKLCSPKRKIIKRLKESERVDNTVIKYAIRITRGIIYIVALYLTIAELGYNISGLVTGLGLSSVVIALAAQDLAKNLIAGLSILTDKPYKLGDWLQVDKYEGTVEYINIKSTRIRTMDNSIVIIPNLVMSTTSIVNWSRLEKRKFETTLKLPLTTNKDVVEKIRKRIEFMLENDEEILKDDIRVNFTEINNDSIQLNILTYTKIIDLIKYYKFKTRINMAIMEIIEEEQVKLAYPGRDVYIHNN